MSETLIPVRYIGKKPSQYDTVLGRKRLTWAHHGDVQWVPEADARVYVRYTDIWAIAEDMAHMMPPSLLSGALPASAASAPPSPPAAVPLPADSGDTDDAGAADPEDDAEDEDATVAAPKFSDEEAKRRINDIILVYKKLKTKDYGRDGKPKATRLSQILRRQVYASERDAAHAIVQRAIQHRADESRAALVNATPEQPSPAVDVEPASDTLGLPDIPSGDAVE